VKIAIGCQLSASLKIALYGETQRKIVNLSVYLRVFSVFSVFLFFILGVVPLG
jgi:hypothetical protein